MAVGNNSTKEEGNFILNCYLYLLKGDKCWILSCHLFSTNHSVVYLTINQNMTLDLNLGNNSESDLKRVNTATRHVYAYLAIKTISSGKKTYI